MRARKRRVIGYAWSNPRLPSELLQMVKEGERRRTIGEPERLAKQLYIMLESKNLFAKFRVHVRTAEKFVSRRRSFDFGEWKDEVEQVSDTLGYEFDEPYQFQTIGQIKRDLVFMKARMAGMNGLLLVLLLLLLLLMLLL